MQIYFLMLLSKSVTNINAEDSRKLVKSHILNYKTNSSPNRSENGGEYNVVDILK